MLDVLFYIVCVIWFWLVKRRNRQFGLYFIHSSSLFLSLQLPFWRFCLFFFPTCALFWWTIVFQLDAFSVEFILNTLLAPFLGRPLNPQAAAEAEKVLSSSLSKIEALWLKESGQFLHGSSQPSIADLCLVCEIMQLEVCSLNHRFYIIWLVLLLSWEKIQWIVGFS